MKDMLMNSKGERAISYYTIRNFLNVKSGKRLIVMTAPRSRLCSCHATQHTSNDVLHLLRVSFTITWLGNYTELFNCL